MNARVPRGLIEFCFACVLEASSVWSVLADYVKWRVVTSGYSPVGFPRRAPASHRVADLDKTARRRPLRKPIILMEMEQQKEKSFSLKKKVYRPRGCSDLQGTAWGRSALSWEC